MKIETYKEPKSRFLSIDKDMAIIVNKIFENERIKKLLYYTTKDCLDKPNLSSEMTAKMFGEQIRIVPKLEIDSSILNYIVVDFDKFRPNDTNPEFRDNMIAFHIICHFDQWHLNDYQLRPYRIAGELDSMFNKQKFSGIGQLLFSSCDGFGINDEFSGLSLIYSAMHGVEDEKFPLTPIG